MKVDMKYCGECGSKLESDSAYCSNCGKKVIDSSKKENKSSNNKSNKSQENKSKDEISFLEKQVHDAGNAGVTLGWLNIIITLVLFIFGSSLGEEFNYSLIDVSIYVPFAVMVIILSNRLKIVKTTLLKKYLYILLGSSIGLIALSVWAGGGVGWLWILFIFQLYRAIQASNKLFSIPDYEEESLPEFKVKKPHWVLLAIFSFLLFIVGIQTIDSYQYTPEEFREEFMVGCLDDSGPEFRKYCNCAHNYLINNYSMDEIIGLDSQPSKANVVYDRVADYCSEYLPSY
jgi:hypothetical protein